MPLGRREECQMGGYRMAVGQRKLQREGFQMEEFQTEECLKEAMGARWWHQHASCWRRHRSGPGVFPRAVFRRVACQMGALLMGEHQRVVGQVGASRTGECPTGEGRMGSRMEAVGEC